jgi:hypothetical protein
LVLRSHETERWLPCHVETGGHVAELKDQQGTVYQQVPAKECHPMHESSLVPVANMVELGDLNEAAILHNLRMRYRECVVARLLPSIQRCRVRSDADGVHACGHARVQWRHVPGRR